MRLHLVDGTFELYRAHYSKRPAKTDPEGRDIKATEGLVSSMKALLADPDEAVTHLAIAFDNPIRSFRNDLFDGYKSDEGVPPELRAQFDGAETRLPDLGFVVWSMAEYEADDALASAATQGKKRYSQVRILSPDKDFGQVVDGDRVVLVDRIRGKVLNEQGVFEKMGVKPSQIADFLALVGDTADGIPGVPGIGEKTAAALLLKWGRLEDIPTDPRALGTLRGAEKVAQALASHREKAQLYKRLATLVVDLPLALGDELAVPRGERAV